MKVMRNLNREFGTILTIITIAIAIRAAFEECNTKKHDAEWYSCSVYGKVCALALKTDFLECSGSEVQKSNGMVAYTQATCSEDGEAIAYLPQNDCRCILC